MNYQKYQLLLENNSFGEACENGHLEEAQCLFWSNPNPNFDISFNNDIAFREACENGHLEVAQWLFEIKPNILNIKPNTQVQYELFVNDEKIKIKPKKTCDDVFGEACKNGHLKVAQWLLEIKPDINISAYEEYAFRGACKNGHLEIAQWLLKIKPEMNFTNTIFFEHTFREACSKGHIEIAKLLLKIKPDINISSGNENAFCWACHYGHLETAQWLQSLRPWLYKIIINNNDNKFKIKAHINTPKEQRFERRKYVVWLYSLKTKMNKECLFHKLPNELLRVIAMTL